jgi:hypothetical protein
VLATPGRWVLQDIGRLEPSRSQSASATEIAEMAQWPAGTRSLPIVAAQPFDLNRDAGHRVAIKAIQMTGAQASGLSLTSLQPLEGGCN